MAENGSLRTLNFYDAHLTTSIARLSPVPDSNILWARAYSLHEVFITSGISHVELGMRTTLAPWRSPAVGWVGRCSFDKKQASKQANN